MEYLAEGTRTDKALALANTALFTKEGGDRRNGVNILIVITDGKTNPIHSVPYETVLAPLRVGFFLSFLPFFFLFLLSLFCAQQTSYLQAMSKFQAQFHYNWLYGILNF